MRLTTLHWALLEDLERPSGREAGAACSIARQLGARGARPALLRRRDEGVDAELSHVDPESALGGWGWGMGAVDTGQGSGLGPGRERAGGGQGFGRGAGMKRAEGRAEEGVAREDQDMEATRTRGFSRLPSRNGECVCLCGSSALICLCPDLSLPKLLPYICADCPQVPILRLKRPHVFFYSPDPRSSGCTHRRS